MLRRFGVAAGFVAAVAGVSSLDAAVVSTSVSIPGARDLVFDDARNRVYVTGENGQIERYDFASGLLTPWTPGGDLRSIDITPDGSSLYVTDAVLQSGKAVVRKVNVATGTSTSIPYDITEGAGSFDVVVLNNGKALLTTDHQFSGGGTSVRFVDVATGAVSVRANDGVERETDLFRSRDRSRVFMTGGNTSAGNVRVYDVATDSYLVNVNTWAPLNGISAALSPNGSLLAYEGYNVAPRLFEAATLTEVDSFDHNRPGLGFSPLGLLFIADEFNDQFLVYDPALGRQIDAFPAGFDMDPFDTDGRMAFSPDGKTMIFQYADGLRIYTGVVPEPGGATVLLLGGTLIAARRRRAAR